MKWIEVSNKPQTRKSVYLLAFTEDYGVIKVLYNDKTWYAMTGNIVFPTHWMPLPSPPAKKKAVVKEKAVKKAPKKVVKKAPKKAAKPVKAKKQAKKKTAVK